MRRLKYYTHPRKKKLGECGQDKKETIEQARERRIKILLPGGIYVCKDDSIDDRIAFREIRDDVFFVTPEDVRSGVLDSVHKIKDLICDPEYRNNNAKEHSMFVKAALKAYRYKKEHIYGK